CGVCGMRGTGDFMEAVSEMLLCLVILHVLFLGEFQACKMGSSDIDRSCSSHILNWQSPSAGGLKLNTDAALNNHLQMVSLRGVVRDQHGVVIACCAIKRVGLVSVGVAELLAILEALKFCYRE
ncbi:hypothetical protein PanWU01x14_030110, partial [Parasponia andersonii]